MKALCVIPARYGSTRLPAKPLVDIGGVALVRRVYERIASATMVDRIVVATDDMRIFNVIKDFGGEAIMTSAEIASGTERVAEVATRIDADIYINVQGDEPFVRSSDVDKIIELLINNPNYDVSSLCHVMDKSDYANPNAVKVVFAHDGKALYFSRSQIPYFRRSSTVVYQHVGLYGYRRKFLIELKTQQFSPLEDVEQLEQLRFLQAGIPIIMGCVKKFAGPSIDTYDDLECARSIIALENMTPHE